jgi:hypothetical protein
MGIGSKSSKTMILEVMWGSIRFSSSITIAAATSKIPKGQQSMVEQEKSVMGLWIILLVGTMNPQAILRCGHERMIMPVSSVMMVGRPFFCPLSR